MPRFGENLNPQERREWEEFIRFQRETNIAEMADSAVVFSLYPTSGKFDVEYALQVGAMILLEKPILVLKSPGQKLPPKLELVADKVLEVDSDSLDTASDDVRGEIMAFVREHVPAPVHAKGGGGGVDESGADRLRGEEAGPAGEGS